MSNHDAPASGSENKALPVLPLRNLILFPGSVIPVDVGRAGSLRLVEDLLQSKSTRLLVATQRDPQIEDPAAADLHPIVVDAELLKVIRAGDSRLTAVIRGITRRHLGQALQQRPYLVAEHSAADEIAGPPGEAGEARLQGFAMSVRDAAKEFIDLSPNIPDEAAQVLDQVKEPSRLADVVAANLDFTAEERTALLGELDVAARLHALLSLLQRRVEVLKVKERIDTQVREEFSRAQRESVLRQRLKAIQEELGEGDESGELDEFEERIRKAGMPADVEAQAKKQLSRLRGMQASSSEYNVGRTYLEWLVDLPWSKRTEDRLDLAEARKILDEDHYDLDKIKRRIVEYLAVRKLSPSKKGPILCFVGPPGVGKTSLGKSIARALGREFLRVSLGGVRDEAEVRGHRRTYVGALPGRIIQGMKRVGTKNPVFLLDEIDKMSSDMRGDPGAAMLEVLDPEQNSSFSDHYLEVPFDLSEVIFIATANQLDTIPGPLRDRMEIIRLAGYTRFEKRHIARRYLVPKQLREHGLTDENLTITDAAIDEVISHYTREAGVRSLERELASVARGVAVKVAAGDGSKVAIDEGDLDEFLGPQKFFSEIAERTDSPGVVTGLAWTPVGGEILFIEATKMPGKGTMRVTGQLGDVMKESVQAALSFTRSHAGELGIPDDAFEKIDIHVHVPDGATPKDGPSAGNAMLAAIVSLMTDRNVRSDTAMTGEITLRGNVLPVGGIKEKVLAAHRAGIKRVILPARNEQDLVDVPEEVRREIEFIPVKRVEEMLRNAIAAPAEVAKSEPMLMPIPGVHAERPESTTHMAAKGARR